MSRRSTKQRRAARRRRAFTLLARARVDPARFAALLGATLQPWQAEVLRWLSHARAGRLRLRPG